ncbi:MAG TPA: aminotransferase class I/II-fold pyridoxal phosphate-dependent enzyme [Candidatus Thermoplasmatota archaeon]|nr:aminotransferase class I/II-fold pyridoxal phosphate-dependent enzyme [Candidatus Thermoplasmatota archaeon]
MSSHRLDHRFVSERVQVFPQSVIRSMSRVANECGAVNLGQGFPDFDPPAELLQAAKDALDAGYNQYAMTWGAPQLRSALVDKLRDRNGIDADADRNVTVTVGATEAMMATLLATCDAGDEVVVLEPFYENFGPDAVVSGATPVHVPLRAPDFQPDEEALKQAMARKPKAVIVNTPGNPTGRMFTMESLRLVRDLCVDNDVLCVTDEIYEELVYDGKRHVSPATLPDMAERTVTIGGFSKTYAVTGWRLAYTVADAPVTDAIRRVHDFLTVGAAHPLQVAAVTALRFPESYYDGLRRDYQAKRDLILPALEAAGFRCSRPDSAYYVLADYASLAQAGAPAQPMEFALWLAREVGVACIPGTSFVSEPARAGTLVRFAFPKREATLREAARRLAEAPAKAAAAGAAA